MAPTAHFCTDDAPTSRTFLKFLRWPENLPRDDDGVHYVTYGRGISDISRHPNVRHKRWVKTPTFAGAHQIVAKTWDAVRRNGIAHLDLERFAGRPYWDHVLPFLER